MTKEWNVDFCIECRKEVALISALNVMRMER